MMDAWVVVVSTSRYWSNYRHAANALAVAERARHYGVPASHVLTLLAEPCACRGANVFSGSMYLRRNSTDVFEDARVDVGYESVSPKALRDVLTGRSPLLKSGPNSNVVLYLTGHGGAEFLKFHDADEISSVEIAAALTEMRIKRRYRKLLVIVDTCQAGSLFHNLDDDVLGFASSILGQNAYASFPDPNVGVALSDRFTDHLAARFFADDLDLRTTSLGTLARDLAGAHTRSTLDVHEPTTWDWRSTSLADFFRRSSSVPSV